MAGTRLPFTFPDQGDSGDMVTGWVTYPRDCDRGIVEIQVFPETFKFFLE